jgi:predicted nucleic acid-binding protein
VKTRTYVDTSAIAGCLDEEFREYSEKLLESFASGDSVLLLSDLTLRELEKAPVSVRQVLEQVPEQSIEVVSLNEESAELAQAYIESDVVSVNMLIDAQHIAVATVERADVLVSWNFRHIVNLHRIHGYNSVNIRRGYPMLEIRSPREVMKNE